MPQINNKAVGVLLLCKKGYGNEPKQITDRFFFFKSPIDLTGIELFPHCINIKLINHVYDPKYI